VTPRAGIDRLRDAGYSMLAGKRVGLLTHAAAVDHNFVSSYRILTESPAVQVAALFAPEHGFRSAARDGLPIGHSLDSRTGLPIFSLYGSNYRPSAEMLQGLDAIVCDIQDIGVRYYTYIWTMYEVLQAAGAVGLEVIVLDRPNPLGDRLAGPLVEPHLYSLVGGAPLPVCHGMTCAEVAQLLNSLWNPTSCRLTVVRCSGWERHEGAQPSGQGWVSPSPNMPQWITARHYAGSCLIEGTNLSEGRGTALPFEIAGAPFIDGDTLADALNRQGLPGVRWRPTRFQPTASKWAGEECGGVQAHLTDVETYDALRAWLTLIVQVMDLYPESFEWRLIEKEPYVFDRLIGNERVRQHLEARLNLSTLWDEWAGVGETFAAVREPYLLY
jgi:uncharacterized protein YbbC (DUF1343 family)